MLCNMFYVVFRAINLHVICNMERNTLHHTNIYGIYMHKVAKRYTNAIKPCLSWFRDMAWT